MKQEAQMAFFEMLPPRVATTHFMPFITNSLFLFSFLFVLKKRLKGKGQGNSCEIIFRQQNSMALYSKLMPRFCLGTTILILCLKRSPRSPRWLTAPLKILPSLLVIESCIWKVFGTSIKRDTRSLRFYHLAIHFKGSKILKSYANYSKCPNLPSKLENL